MAKDEKRGRRYARPAMSKVLAAFKIIIDQGHAADYAGKTEERQLRLIASRELIDFTLDYVEGLENALSTELPDASGKGMANSSRGRGRRFRDGCETQLNCPDDDLFS